MTNNISVVSVIRYDPNLLLNPVSIQASLSGLSITRIPATDDQLQICKDSLDPILFFLFPRHVARLNTAFQHFWPDTLFKLDGATLVKALYPAISDLTRPHRLRTILSSDGSITVEPSIAVDRNDLFSGLRPDQDPESPWKIYLDSHPTTQSDLTMFKTSDRSAYSVARERVLPASVPISSPIEILLYNPRNEITEGSLTNVAFFRNGKWVTPSSSSIGGLRGSVKAELLASGAIHELSADENPVLVSSLIEGEKILLMNGVQGCTCGFYKSGSFP
ncbi:aminotransferase class IV-domain-containing protein [Lipomyces oligophaga]|uniref:aminotransferase class IV-domain-containing protein n=1 Tax=Lipomyces oligophaga TaxID=45792 RepID=UPI0034CF8051